MSSKPIAVYLRVSTDDQDHASQRAEAIRWLDRQGIAGEKVEWYVDTESGRKSSRPAFDKLQTDIAKARRTTVLVFALDRISRDLLDGMTIVGQWCKAGVRVASITQELDISGTVGRIVAAVLFGLAELEWSLRRDRQRAGIDVAKTRGVYKGRKSGTTKAKPERARELKAKGYHLREIALSLGVNVRSVTRYLAQTSEPRTSQ